MTERLSFSIVHCIIIIIFVFFFSCHSYDSCRYFSWTHGVGDDVRDTLDVAILDCI